MSYQRVGQEDEHEHQHEHDHVPQVELEMGVNRPSEESEPLQVRHNSVHSEEGEGSVQLESTTYNNNPPPYHTHSDANRTTEAVELPSTSTSSSSSSSSSSSFDLTLIQSGVSPNHTVLVTSSTPLSYIRDAAFPSVDPATDQPTEYHNKLVRFIYMGKLLSNQQVTLKELGIEEEGCAIHVHVSERIEPEIPVAVPVAGVSASMAAAAAMGLTEGDASHYEAWATNQRELGLQSDVPSYQQAIQEADQYRIQQQSQQSATYTLQEREGTQAEFICGFTLGFVFGIFALIWLWQSNISRKQRAGIFVGIAINLMLNISRTERRANETNSNDHPDVAEIPLTPQDVVLGPKSG